MPSWSEGEDLINECCRTGGSTWRMGEFDWWDALRLHFGASKGKDMMDVVG